MFIARVCFVVFDEIDRSRGARIGTVFGSKIVPASDAVWLPYYKSYSDDQSTKYWGPKVGTTIGPKMGPLFFPEPRFCDCKNWPKFETKLVPERNKRAWTLEIAIDLTIFGRSLVGFGYGTDWLFATSGLVPRRNPPDEHRCNKHPYSRRRPGMNSSSSSF